MAKEGFIVHPNWTGDDRYHASYPPNHNKTVRSFDTLKQAKAFLAKKGYTQAMYKSSTANVQTVKTKAAKRKAKAKPRVKTFGGYW